MQRAARSGAHIRHMFHCKTMVLLATHSWWCISVTLALALSGPKWSSTHETDIHPIPFCWNNIWGKRGKVRRGCTSTCFFLDFVLLVFSMLLQFLLRNKVIHSFKKALLWSWWPSFCCRRLWLFLPVDLLLHSICFQSLLEGFSLYNTSLCVFKPIQPYKGQCCHCPLLSLHFESKQKPKCIDIHVEVVCSFATRLREITGRDRKTVGSQQNATWRSHSWLWKCYNIKHLLALGAALPTDCHVQNATDALEGFERLEKCPDGFFP